MFEWAWNPTLHRMGTLWVLSHTVDQKHSFKKECEASGQLNSHRFLSVSKGPDIRMALHLSRRLTLFIVSCILCLLILWAFTSSSSGSGGANNQHSSSTLARIQQQLSKPTAAKIPSSSAPSKSTATSRSTTNSEAGELKKNLDV